jgi:two-component sensor histidine kinase
VTRDLSTTPVTQVPPVPDETPAKGERRRGTRLSIGLLMSLLIAVTIIPPLAFSLILLQRNNIAQQELLTTLAEATAGSIAESVDRQKLGMLNTLRVLSTAASLEQDNFAEFYERSRAALDGTGAYLIVIDGDMRQLLNTRVAFGTPLGRTSDPRSAEAAFETGEAVFSDGFFGETAQRWVFNVILPYRPPGGAERLLVMTQNAETLSGALARQNLRGGWNAALIDRNGIVMASTFLSSDIGKPFFINEFGDDSAQSRQVLGQDGEQYETITKRSELSGWRTVVWAPAAIVQQPMISALRWLVLGGLAMIAIGAIGAWFLGRQISKPMRRLAQEARLLGAGDDVAMVASPVTEIATVSAAMVQAAQDRRQAENEIRFLMREVAHRSKNQLTVVSSIAKQTARNAASIEAFQDGFQKRIQGLARSTDLLIAGGVAGVELAELIRSHIEPFRPADESRFEIGGPRFRLSNQAAQTLGLALHELATNAAKYGAFQAPSGRLSVDWKRTRDRLEIVWREHVPFLPSSPETRGFGTEVIERMLGGAMEAEIERTLHADGLEMRFSIPLERLRPEAQAQAAAGE